jgi:uncharacterized phage infection (PIP) family protein YhgE
MNHFKRLMKNKFIPVGLVVPMVIQALFLFIFLPAVLNAEDRIERLTIALVNEDEEIGSTIASSLEENLPFGTDNKSNVEEALAENE